MMEKLDLRLVMRFIYITSLFSRNPETSRKLHFMETSYSEGMLWSHDSANGVIKSSFSSQIILRHPNEMLLLGLLTLQVLCFVHCYPNGAPTGACMDMMPRHVGVEPQTSPAPYTILTNMKKYLPGMPVTGRKFNQSQL